METFAFPYHILEVNYPDSGAAISFGGGYEFTSKPRAPDQIEYILNFKAMWFFTDLSDAKLDVNKNPKMNMGRLEEFYNRHKMYGKFWYPHQTQGLLKVRFSEPLKYKIAENGGGRVESFSMKLKLQP